MLLLVAGAARAEPDDARAHFVAGTQHFDAGRYREAAREFEEAYRRSHRPALHYNLGVCYERLGEVDRAVDAYEKYLAAVPNASDRPAVEARIAALKKPAVVVESAPPARETPKRRWIWGVVGGVAGLVVVGVVVGAVVGTRDNTRTLPDLSLR
jgi:tetratricopeptide (TPR) repeat protein